MKRYPPSATLMNTKDGPIVQIRIGGIVRRLKQEAAESLARQILDCISADRILAEKFGPAPSDKEALARSRAGGKVR